MTAVLEPVARPAPDHPYAQEWALVERAQAGDVDAFGDLYRQTYDAVFRFVYFRTGSRHTAEDLAADTYVRALGAIGRLTWQGRSVAAWLVTIARNLVADYFKSGRYQYEASRAEFFDDEQIHLAEEQADPDAVAARRAGLAAVRRVLADATLSDDQREVIELRFYRGLSTAETAAAVGSTEGAVKAMQYRAIQQLRRFAPELQPWR